MSVSAMNLLLLLSALLSALTGIGGSVRQPPVAQAVAQQTRAAVAATVAQRVAARPVQVLATLSTSAVAPIAAALALFPAEPAYATRRRE
ncbi:hypothetical protein [Sphingomonas adhaesiva]|uniref:hypothetical protein n=1 Tax=Sphingomonas adhaesiva TaxID=28212 RepID=UPI002FF4D7BC